MRKLATALLTPLLLGGCALQVIQSVPGGAPARGANTAGASTVIEGRINYEIDGVSKAPYGAFRPKWLAPRFTALRLESRSLFVSPAVDNRDGSFRWSLPPGSYLLTKIGTGSFIDDTYIAWPGVVLCVPDRAAGPLYAGHLHLAGESNAELRSLSDGHVYHSRAIRYAFRVTDERNANNAPAPLFRVDPALPIGDRLLETLEAAPTDLARRACPNPQ